MSSKHKDPRRGSGGSSGWSSNLGELPSDVKKAGYLKKLKTMKKKFFVLRNDSEAAPARLEYYDSEKKWRSGVDPKRSITLKACFNINRKLDSKQKFAIALYTQDDCFAVVTENEEELDQWLTSMLELQHDCVGIDGESKPKPLYEHVWQVIVKNKGLGSSKNICGPHRLCLTSKTLSLVKMSSCTEKPDALEFPLMSIRRCGHSDCFFFMELGRSAITGSGELWMQTEETIIAQNMHEAILGAMKSSRNREDLGPLSRPRSASTSENTKPIATRRPIGVVMPQPLSAINPSLSSSRERCDSMPSRPRTVTEVRQDLSYSPLPAMYVSTGYAHHMENSRPHSVYAWPTSYSPPSLNSLSAGTINSSPCASGGTVSFEELETLQPQFHLSRFPHTLPTDGTLSLKQPIKEEVPDEYLIMSPSDCNKADDSQKSNYLAMDPTVNHTIAVPSATQTNSLVTPEANKSSFLKPADYMDMTSPSSSNPESYIPMSVIGSLNVDITLTSRQNKVPLDQRLSPEKMTDKLDSYIPMAPGGAAGEEPVPLQDGYLDMTPVSNSLPKVATQSGCNMEVADLENSSNSVKDTSVGSVPSDSSSAFVLDKVASFLKNAEESSQDYIKPVRAYSIGSRPQVDQLRARAYSVGSQAAKPKLKQVSIDSHLGAPKNIDSSSTKSSSAPMLESSLSRGRPLIPKGDYDDDLMEIDYNKLKQSEQSTSTSIDQENTEYVRRWSFSMARQRSNSRSSCGASPMSSVLELGEKIERQTREYARDHKNTSFETSKIANKECPNSNEICQQVPAIIKKEENDYISMVCTNKDACINSGIDEQSFNKQNIQNQPDFKGNIPFGKFQFPTNLCSSAINKSEYEEEYVKKVSKENQPNINIEQNTNFSCRLQNDQSNKLLHFPCSSYCSDGSKMVSSQLNNQNISSKQNKNVQEDCNYAEENRESFLNSSYTSNSSIEGEIKSEAVMTVNEISSSCNPSVGAGNVDLYKDKEISFQATNTLSVDDNIHGDYVNLDLSQTYGLSHAGSANLTVCANQTQSRYDSSSLMVTPSTSHKYINVKVGKSHSSIATATGDYAIIPTLHSSPNIEKNIPLFPNSFNALQTAGVSGVTVPSNTYGSANNSICVCPPSSSSQGTSTAPKPFRSPQSLPTFRKQMSAPAAPPSLRPELPSPGRKSSCPVTASLSMVKSPAISPASSNKFVALPSTGVLTGLLKVGSSRSPDRSSVSSISSTGDEISSSHSSPKTYSTSLSGSRDKKNMVETPYENISIGSGSASSSRPSSISSEKELNYASLDLAPASSDDIPRSPRALKMPASETDNDSATLSYAEIDFTKSEGLRHTSGALREGRL